MREVLNDNNLDEVVGGRLGPIGTVVTVLGTAVLTAGIMFFAVDFQKVPSAVKSAFKTAKNNAKKNIKIFSKGVNSISDKLNSEAPVPAQVEQ